MITRKQYYIYKYEKNKTAVNELVSQS